MSGRKTKSSIKKIGEHTQIVQRKSNTRVTVLDTHLMHIEKKWAIKESNAIRNATEKDLNQILNIRKKAFGDPPLSILYESFISDWIKSESGVIKLVAITPDKKIGGYVIVLIEDNIAHIVSLARLPKYVRMKYGEILLKTALKKLKQNKIKMVYLEVNTKNKVALDLYKKMGFEIKLFLGGFYREIGEDAYRMELNLKKFKGD